MSVRRSGKVEKHGGKVLILFFFKDFALGGKSMSSFLVFLCLDVDLMLDFVNKDYLGFLSLDVDLMLDLVLHLRGFNCLVVWISCIIPYFVVLHFSYGLLI